MQNVSTNWKNTLGCVDVANRPYFVPISYVELGYSVTDPEAQMDAESSDNGHTGFSETQEVVSTLDKSFGVYATFEASSLILDGSRTMLKESMDGVNTGFTSSVLCNGSCVFSATPTISIVFDTVYDSVLPGVQITWSTAYNEWASAFDVKIYNGETLHTTISVTDNKDIVCKVTHDISNYDKIEIVIKEWCLPFRRARMEDILLGIKETYTTGEIISFEHKRTIDLTSNALPVNQIKYTLANANEEWNPHNPSGAAKYLLAKQPLTYRYGYKIGDEIEWIDGGVAYMSEWKTPTNGITSNFTAGDLMEYMLDSFDKTGITSITLYDLVNTAFMQANIPLLSDGTVRWHIDESLKNTTATLPDDFNYSRAAVVQLAANASMCVMYQDRQGHYRIEPFDNTITTDYLIDGFVSYSNAEVN